MVSSQGIHPGRRKTSGSSTDCCWQWRPRRRAQDEAWSCPQPGRRGHLLQGWRQAPSIPAIIQKRQSCQRRLPGSPSINRRWWTFGLPLSDRSPTRWAYRKDPSSTHHPAADPNCFWPACGSLTRRLLRCLLLLKCKQPIQSGVSGASAFD